MRAPMSWLADYVSELPPPGELARRLTMAGLEVEDVYTPDKALVDNLVVASIEAVEAHPNADRLSLCEVNDGQGVRRVVCGATNMSVGDRVVLARPGASLPSGAKIKKSRIRGEQSDGMLCSAAELGIGEGEEGILILGSEARVGAQAASLLGLADCVLEISITPNRGDCLSMRGLAREIAAVCELELLAAFHKAWPTPQGSSRFEVCVDSPHACPLYRGLEVSDVRVGASPAWLCARLSAAGLRPINNVVDVTNYVLLDRGQPLHAFDAALLVGDVISVRVVEDEVEFETLDEQTRRLLAGDLAIWDQRGPIALAGVMGGLRTAVGERTRNLFLEAAVFAPGNVRATSRRLGLVSESSYRFERGIDGAAVEAALVEAANLIVEVAGGEVAGGIARGGPGLPARQAVRVRPARVKHILGVAVGDSEIEHCLKALGADYRVDAEAYEVRAPAHRHDLGREIDWIEEVVRLRGYDSVPEERPEVPMSEAALPPQQALEARLRERLTAIGMTEVVGLAFCSSERNAVLPGLHAASGSVQLLNPLRADATELRRSIVTTLVDAHAGNVRIGARVTDLFSIGRTFAQGADAAEAEVVGGLLWGPRRARGPGSAGAAEFGDAKAAVEVVASVCEAAGALQWRPCENRPEYHPRQSAVCAIAGEVVGYAGRIHPDVAEALEISHDACIFEIETQRLAACRPSRSGPRPVPRFPASSRDISLLVPEGLLAGSVMTAVEELREPLVESVSVFDEYVGSGIPSGHRALAFSIVYRAPDRTLTDEEVASLHDRVVARLCKQLDVRPRT